MTTTRGEIAAHLDDACLAFPATRGDILAAAARPGARPRLAGVLSALPERTYGHLRDLWPHLPEVPADL
jgi:hypothetical protein